MSKTTKNVGTGLDLLTPSKFIVDFINNPAVTLTSTPPSYPSEITDYSSINVNWNNTVNTIATDNTLVVNGFMVIRNSGNQTATICSALVNLQRTTGGKWKTIVDTNNVDTATAMANLAFNNNAKTVNIVSSASSEAKSTFSKSDRFVKSNNFFYLDADTTVTSFVKGTDGLQIRAGEIKALAFNCVFNAKELKIQAGNQLRLECIVTFDNAGARGGSGSSVTSLDADGFTGSELNVRSIPERFTFTVPALKTCNDNLTLAFGYGTPNTTNFAYNEETNYNIMPMANVSSFQDFNLTGVITDADDNIRNPLVVELFNVLNHPGELYDPLTWTNINYPDITLTYQFTRCAEINQRYNFNIVIQPEIPEEKSKWDEGDSLTLEKKDWSTSNVLVNSFATYYPQGLSFVYGNNYVKWTNVNDLKKFLATSYKQNEPLLNNSISTSRLFQSVNPATTISKNYLQQLVALRLNGDLCVPIGDSPSPLNTVYKLGDIKFTLPSTSDNSPIYNLISLYGLNGLTISQFYNNMKFYLWTDNVTDINILNDYATIAENLNSAFKSGNSSKGQPSGFANKFLTW